MNLQYISIIIVSLYILSLYISIITFKFIHTTTITYFTHYFLKLALFICLYKLLLLKFSILLF